MNAVTLRRLVPQVRWRSVGLACAPLAFVVAGALALRLVALALSATAPIDADGANFVRTAENLRHGYGYLGIRGTLSAVHVSLYPVVIAALSLGERVEQAAIAISLVAGTLLVLPVYRIARRLAGRRAALAAAALVAVHPLAIAVSVQPLADALALTLSVAGIDAFLCSRERPLRGLTAGALFGLAYCTRSEGLVYAAVAVLVALIAVALPGGERRRAGLRLGGLLVAFAVFAVPYAVAVSRATGHVRHDAKGPVNYALGTRIASGMSYAQAAAGLGPGLREDGPELGAGFYQNHAGIADPPLGQRLAFAARVAPAQLRRLARLMAGSSFGTPLFALLALAGLARGLTRREARADQALLAAFAALDVAALCTLDHLWTRYAVGLVPYCAIWAAEPLAAMAGALRARSAPWRFAALAALAAALALLFLGWTEKKLVSAAGDATELRRAAAWIDEQAPGPKLILAVGSATSYYAHGDWMPLPYSSSADALAYLHRARPTYVVLEAAEADARPYLAGWLAHGIPDPAARAVHAAGAPTPGAVAVYEWRPNDARAFEAPARTGPVDVLTAHNGPARLGWNDRETVLTAANVGSPRFGKLFTLRVDGQVYAQPLIASGIALPGRGRRDVLLAATENDSVYAFDADSGATLWVRSFVGGRGVTPATVRAVSDDDCQSVSPKIGISSTPVVDPRTQTVYVVAKTMAGFGFARRFHNTLHALALTTGADRLRPAEIDGSAPVSLRGLFAPGRSFKHGLKRLLLGGRVRFDARAQYDRTGLLLQNGNLYFGFGSHCDIPSARGWVFAYRASDLTQVAAFATVGDWNDANGAGVWQSGFGLTGDGSGDVYFTTGNGPFDAASGGRDYGDSLLRMAPDLSRVVDYFTPGTQAELAANDADFGGGALIALPAGAGPHPLLGVASSKVRAIFLLDRQHLGRYRDAGPDRALDVIGDAHSSTDWCTGTCGGPAYYAGPRGEYVFDVWAQDALRAYRVERGAEPRLVEVAHTPDRFPGSGGAIPSVSSNGASPGTGVVWATTRPDIRDVMRRPIELRAYDAADVSRPLFRGDAGLWPNRIGHPFLTPTIANGKVYVGGYATVSVFGLRAPRSRTANVPVALSARPPAGDESRLVQREDGTYGAVPEVRGRTKIFRLVARDAPWTLKPGLTVAAQTYNGVVPGPTLVVEQGDRVVIDYTNRLAVPDTIHLHGVHGAPLAMDGVPGISQPMVPPGGHFRYAFDARQDGTYFYHTHDGEAALDSGLYGGIIVLPAHPRALERVAHDDLMLISAWQTGHAEENHFTLNGKEYPATRALEVRRGERMRIRWINVSSENEHTMHTHGHDQRVIARDARPVPYDDEEDTVLLGPGQRVDVLVTADAQPGTWLVHCHFGDHVETAGMPAGLITAIHYAGTPNTLADMASEMAMMPDGAPDAMPMSAREAPPAQRGRSFAVGLLAAGALAGAVLALTLAAVVRVAGDLLRRKIRTRRG